MVCVDATVWIYFLDRDVAEHESVRRPVSSLLGSDPVFTTTVLQMEVLRYLRNQLVESEPAKRRFLSLADVTVADLTVEDVRTASDLLGEYSGTGIGGRDATVVAAMARYDIERLWTHDERSQRLGGRLDWLDVTDPVEPAV